MLFASSLMSEDLDRRIIFLTSENGLIDASGRFEIRGVTGRVFFRPSNLPNNLVLKSVIVNGVDMTDRPYDAANGDLSGLEIVVADQAQVTGTAKNARGEPMRDFRVALFPARAKPSPLDREVHEHWHRGSQRPLSHLQAAGR